MNNIQVKERLLQAFPPVPAGYGDSIDTVLQSIDTKPLRLLRTGKQRPKLSLGKMVAAVLALIIIGSSCVFAASPALAADIPVINEIVYTVSATVEPNLDIQNKIAETVQEVLSAFISNATENIGVRFKSGDNWVLNEDTLLAAYYLHFEAASAELLNQGKTPALANIAVKNIEAEQKGFRYTAKFTYDIFLDDESYTTETVTAQLEESVSGLHITSLNIISEGFEKYKAYITLYDRAEYGGGTLDENIANYNAFLIARQMALDELEQHEQVADTEMTRDKQLENLAAELCYRYWSSTEMPEMSDIMERNDDTELWFLALELRMESHTPVMAEKGYAEIWEITDETDELVTAKLYVKTIIDGGVGQEVQITFKSTGDKFIIVAYSSLTWNDGLDGQLERLANQYMNEGMSHSDANQKAYETLRIELLDMIKKLEDLNRN